MADRKPKLCVITTGGTIEMVRDDDGVARPAETPDDFQAILSPLADRYDLGVLPLMNRDSSNMIPADWSLIAQTISECPGEGFDGFVVTHGTDTLAHTAAAVAYALGPPPLIRPVVFTGAQRTPDAEGYDGFANLESACRVAADQFGEVGVVFNQRILRGCRCEKISATSLDAFAAPETYGLGRVTEDSVALHDDAVRRGNEEEHPGWEPETRFAEGVISITLSPGLEVEPYQQLLESHHTTGVLLRTFGAGNVPDRDETDWTAFIRHATQRDIPVVLLSPFRGGRSDQSDYAVGRAAVDAGAIALGDLTPASIEVKFRHTLAGAIDRQVEVVPFVRNVMQANYFGELGGSPQSTSPE